MKQFCGFSAPFLTAPALCGAQAPTLAAGARWPLCFCAFIATQTRGERVLSTCLGHIFVTRESGTIVTFSCGAQRGHASFPSENTIIVLSVGALGWLCGPQQGGWSSGEEKYCSVVWCPYAAVL